jgi:hypothetical protein
MGKLCCATEHSVQFFVQFFYTVLIAQFNLVCMGPFKHRATSGFIYALSTLMVTYRMGKYCLCLSASFCNKNGQAHVTGAGK